MREYIVHVDAKLADFFAEGVVFFSDLAEEALELVALV
jgi:hypothetical protein